ncbi:MAG TPA: CRISPR-associated endonuclease Cas3'', partial [Chthoniobacteraceae bacterium]|nr:CRISPR-associated endonuclease Cas3'' [Chthoniobacteraceae bacterium]
MTYYGHTAVDAEGKPDPNVDRWQTLAAHLEAVARTAAGFAYPIGMEGEAELAGSLHDVGKYAARFQARLRNPAAVHGVNHWAAGAVSAVEGKLWSVAFAVDGHHTGIPALRGAESLDQTHAKFRDARLREEFTRCPESIPELLDRLVADGLALPTLAPRAVTDRFAEALRTRLLFSCLVDADFLDTEGHFKPDQMR